MTHPPDRFSVVLPEWMNRDDAVQALLYVKHFEEPVFERAVEFARTVKEEREKTPPACQNCGEPGQPDRPLVSTIHLKDGHEYTEWFCDDVRECYARAHPAPCVECGGAYPGHQLACSLRPAGQPT